MAASSLLAACCLLLAIVTEARKIAEKLEEAIHSKEALLLNQRIKLCEVALNLAERASSMPIDEMARSVTPLQSAGVQLPFSLQLKLVARHCAHHASKQDPENFLEIWSPWAILSEVDEFDPVQPLMKSLVATLADKETILNNSMDDEEMGKVEMESKNKDLSEEWQAGFQLLNVIYYIYIL